jgi:hypothetical protein
VNGPDPGEDWLEIKLDQWEIWTDGPADPRLTQAGDEIEDPDGATEVLATIVCRRCREGYRLVAREFATSVGRVWRIYHPKDYLSDNFDKPGEPLRCKIHGTDHLARIDPR